MYRDNDSGLWPSSYPYVIGRALNEYRINSSVTIYYLDHSLGILGGFVSLIPLNYHRSFSIDTGVYKVNSDQGVYSILI